MTFRLLICVVLVVLVGCAEPSRRFGAVASDHVLASQAGAEMLARGGNAVDAAVATSFALAVVRPQSCGLGGGGFMVIHLPRDPVHGRVQAALNYRERAPKGVSALFYADQAAPRSSVTGASAVAVPGTVRGLVDALDRYGTLDLSDVLAPAIRLAEQGFVADEHYAGAVRASMQRLRDSGEAVAGIRFTEDRYLNRGRVRAGDRVYVPELARALRMIAREGADVVYRGKIADAIVATVQRDGGVIDFPDLSDYRAEWVEPLRFEAFGHQFLTMPPPSSGGIALAQTLRILEKRGYDRVSDRGLKAHLLVEALKIAFADRAAFGGDPAFVPVPVERLLADDYLAARARSIDENRASEFSPMTVSQVGDDSGTSHLCTFDRWGGAVACTETINLSFGSLVAVEDFGFILNNEMDDFTTRPGQSNAFGLVQSPANSPEPGKRPLSSMTPTIMLDPSGRVRAIVGGSGGPRIITAAAQVVLSVLENKSATAALEGPRLHHQWKPEWVYAESGLSPEVIRGLESRGHRLEPMAGESAVQLIRIGTDAQLEAASDPRKGGAPAFPRAGARR
jgi:gamma-glutamyltranspeptidase/glutathione hydrolase